MHSVTYHLDGGGLHASRPVLLLRLMLTLPLAALLLLLDLVSLLLWPLRALQLYLRHERDTRLWESSRRAVEDFAGQAAFLLAITDRWPFGAARVRLAYSQSAERLELVFRPFLGALLLFNALVLAILMVPFWFMQLLHILLWSRRHPGCQRMLLVFLGFVIDLHAYLLLGVEERPPLFPPNLSWAPRSSTSRPLRAGL